MYALACCMYSYCLLCTHISILSHTSSLLLHVYRPHPSLRMLFLRRTRSLVYTRGTSSRTLALTFAWSSHWPDQGNSSSEPSYETQSFESRGCGRETQHGELRSYGFTVAMRYDRCYHILDDCYCSGGCWWEEEQYQQ